MPMPPPVTIGSPLPPHAMELMPHRSSFASRRRASVHTSRAIRRVRGRASLPRSRMLRLPRGIVARYYRNAPRLRTPKTMPKPAARVLDLTTHLAPAMPGTGSPNVFIGGQPAWRTMIDIHTCAIPIAPPFPAPHGPEICYLGSTTVLVNFQMACRMLDILQGLGPPNPFMIGMVTVEIGDVG